MAQSWADREDLNDKERIKLEKDGLTIRKELDVLCSQPLEQLTEGDIFRLQWAGFLQQRLNQDLFIVRIRMACGQLNSMQARKIADIAKTWGDSFLQITTRQCLEIHNIHLKDIPAVKRAIEAAGLTAVESFGDSVRNITGNPLMGVDPEEILDASDLVEKLEQTFVGNPEYSNLPRKLNLCLSASPADNGLALVNDVAFIPAVFDDGTQEINGFHILVGGGLSVHPKVADKLSFFLRKEEVPEVAEAIIRVQREYGYRSHRMNCRMKFLLQDWGVERFEEVLLETIGHSLTRGGKTVESEKNRGIAPGIYGKTDGNYAVGFHVPKGDIRAEFLELFADLSDRFGTGELRLTESQDIFLLHVAKENLSSLESDSLTERFPIHPGNFSGYGVACIGSRYCRFAALDTKNRMEDLVTVLDQRFPEITEPFYIGITGCLHACAQQMTCDIGMNGVRVRYRGGIEEGVSFWIGGHLGEHPEFSRKLPGIVLADDINACVTDLVQYYVDGRNTGESFQNFVQRVGLSGFQKIIDGYNVYEEWSPM